MLKNCGANVVVNRERGSEEPRRFFKMILRELHASPAKENVALRIEQREVRFSGGNRKFSSWGRDSTKNSYVNVVVFGDLAKDVRTTERLKQIRDLIQKAKLEGKTKAADGAVGLYLKDPGQYRREIVDNIFEDIEYLKKHLGPDFEVQPTGLNHQVLLRVCGESDIELWIDYSFGIESIKEMSRPRK